MKAALSWGLFLIVGAAAVFFFFPKNVEDDPKEALSERVRILFVGDTLFDRSVRAAMERRGADFPLSCVAGFLKGYDLVVANLEGPITTYPSVSADSVVGSPENFTFTFPPETAGVLARANIRLVNLGNNHIGNFGREGIEMTKSFLSQAGVSYVSGLKSDSMIYHTGVGGVLLSFVSYNEFGGLSAASTTEIVAEESAAGRMVFAYAHWGEEYKPPPARVRAAAHAFVDAGAYAVFGSHPHVVLEKEIYRSKPIYYSLGNLLFDQYWNDDVRTGLAVEANISQSGIAFKEYKTHMGRDRRVCFAQ